MLKEIKFRIVVVVISLIGLLANNATAKEMTVTYPRFASASDTRFLDIVELLTTAFEKTVDDFGPYKLAQSSAKMNELRYISEAEIGDKINIIWSSTNPSIEKKLIPIRIPLRKGLLGYRVFLINKSDQEKFAAVKTLSDLKKYSVGQGRDWGDVKIYEANKINVVGGTTYEGLFQMLTKHRFDYFARGINEAFKELEDRKDALPEMMVEESMTIYYPWPYYIFVSKTTPEIAIRIEAGFNKMIADGSFDEIFYKYNSESINNAKLDSRKIINIVNPFLPPETPSDREELWFKP